MFHVGVNFAEIGPNDQMTEVSSGNGLTPNERQGTMRTDEDIVIWHIY